MENRNIEIQSLLKEYNGNIRQILTEHPRLDNLYALSEQRELLLEWYEFDPHGELLQVGADYGSMTGLFRTSVAGVTVLDEDRDALETVKLRFPTASNISYVQKDVCAYAREMAESGRKYDYVTMVGGLQESWQQQILAAKSLLRPDGVLILAVDNTLAMKYWGGTPRRERALSKKQLTDLLLCCQPPQACGTARFYYPMPGYRTPVSIYSDRYLPKKGDLTKVTPVYDYPQYRVMEMGEGFDAVCEDGLFDLYANSYLVFWSREADRLRQQEDRIFIKYNKTRREIFQIRTSICQGMLGDQGGLYVEKAALGLDGSAHIESFKDKYRNLTSQHRRLKVAKPSYRESRNAVYFPYLLGQTWAEQLGADIRGGKLPADILRKSLECIFDVESDARMPFAYTEEFGEVLGAGLTEEELSLVGDDLAFRVSNIDALFENILLTEEGNYCLDYEWVLDFPVPEGFVKYRILYYFYEQYSSIMRQTSLQQLMASVGISLERMAAYGKMEQNFQNYVHGDNQKLYLENYLVDSRTAADMRQTEADLARARERIGQMKLQLKEKDVTIRKITEVQRLTNNHVTNLEIIIADLRREVGELGKTLTYLNAHQSLPFKVRRKLGDEFNKKYPRGSAERKRLKYKKDYVTHPIRSMKLYSTEEGRNLRKGDFEIGDIYRQHGKLRFAYEEQPKVSIVIPVYNQIHYTYACLVSILEHTKDVSYEVIIADDVSSDATEHLQEFAEGLVICRNSTNQGFLRNCNHAARKARGQYVMFLNNDTQVTAGWLSSLVNLIEQDPSIGMVGSKLVYPDGRLQEAGGIIWSDGSGWNYGRLDDPDKPEYNYVKDVDYISGAAILLPLGLWNQIGGFDTRFAPAYCEDSDLAFEVR